MTPEEARNWAHLGSMKSALRFISRDTPQFTTQYPLGVSHSLPAQCFHLGFGDTFPSLQFDHLGPHDNKLISHTRGTIVDVQVCSDTDTGRKVEEGVAAKRLIHHSSEKTTVYDTIVAAECSTKMDDGYHRLLSARTITAIPWSMKTHRLLLIHPSWQKE